MIVSKKFSFCAAHFLPGYEGKCANLHGHTWEVEVAVKGPIGPRTGMVVDFTWLKGVLEEEVGKFDHDSLNNFFSNPTAERLAEFLFNMVQCEWIQGPDEPVQTEYVRIWESKDSMAEYNIEDWRQNEKT